MRVGEAFGEVVGFVLILLMAECFAPTRVLFSTLRRGEITALGNFAVWCAQAHQTRVLFSILRRGSP